MPARFPPGTDLLVVGAASLATPEGRSAAAGEAAGRLRVLERPVVAAAGGTIQAVAADPDGRAASAIPPGCRMLDAAGCTLLPGFVDSHTHAAFAGSREHELRLRLAGASYAEIAAAGGGILSTVTATRAASESELLDGLVGRLDLMLLHGATTVEVKSGYGLDRDTELRLLRVARQAGARHPVDVVTTFLGAHSVPAELRHDREAYLRLLDEVVAEVARERLASFCDVFCEVGVFTVAESRRILRRAASLGLGLKVHADELAGTGGAELAAEVGAVSAEHLMHASDAGLAAMARAGVVAVLLPTTSLVLREEPARAARFRSAGCAFAVATDCNPGTSPSENLALSAALACYRNGASPPEALTAITLNGAAALGLAGEIGSLEVGKRMDLVALEGPNADHLVYRVGVNRVRHVVKDGRVVVRDGRRVDA